MEVLRRRSRWTRPSPGRIRSSPWRPGTFAIGGQRLTLQGLGGIYPEIFLPLSGAHQADNAALALAAVEAFFGAGAGKQLDTAAVEDGFAAVSSPGRLERVRTSPTILVDAAHNPHGAAALARALAEEFSFARLVGVLAVMADKDVDGILRALVDSFDDVVVTVNSSSRSMPVDALAAIRRRRLRRPPGAPGGADGRGHRHGRRPRRERRGRRGGRGRRGDHRVGRLRRGRANAGRARPVVTRPYDPERGLRGAISATLVLQAITVLLAIPVARNTGDGTGAGGVVAIVVLAFALIGACAFVKRPWIVWLVAAIDRSDHCRLADQRPARPDRRGVRPGVDGDLLVARGVPAADGGR